MVGEDTVADDTPCYDTVADDIPCYDTVADDIPCYDTVADIPCYDGCYSGSMEVVKVETVGFVGPDVYLRQY